MLDSPMQPLYEYVCHIKGHRNSKGELAEWVIKSHETGKILSSHKSEQKAKEHLQQMHIFNEAAESSGYPKLYHICGYMTGLTDDSLRSILTTGLHINDNGESNCIWFSTGNPFIKDVFKAPLIVSLECTPENIKKYRIDEFDVRNQSSTITVRENVPMEDLNIEQLMWGRIHKGEGTRIYPLTFTKHYADFEKWQRFDKDLQAIIYEDLFNMWAKDDISKQGFNPDLNRLKEIMGDRLTITNFMETKSDKLIGESTYGNNMDKRINIFLEGVSQLGLNSSQLHTIEKLTKVCMESAMDEPSEPRYVSHLFQDEAERNDIESMIDADGNIDNVVAEYGFLLDPSDPDNVTEGVPYILKGSDIIVGTSGPYTLAYNGKMAGAYLLYKKVDDDSSIQEVNEDENPKLGKSALGKICTYDVTNGTPVVQVVSQNVPLQKLTKHREDLLRAAPICKVTSDIQKYSMISPYDEITNTAMQYMRGEISFDPSDDGNVYGFTYTCLGTPSISFWMPNDLDYSGYDDAGKIGGNEEEQPEF